jgi:hypothetical protein
MPRSKTKMALKSDKEGYATLQVPVAIKKVLKAEQSKVLETTDKFKSMHQIVAEALADHFSDNPEYVKILKESGLLD